MSEEQRVKGQTPREYQKLPLSLEKEKEKKYRTERRKSPLRYYETDGNIWVKSELECYDLPILKGSFWCHREQTITVSRAEQ